MMKSSFWIRGITRDNGISVRFLLTMTLIILFSGVIGIFLPHITPVVSSALVRVGEELGAFGTAFWATVTGALVIILVLLLRQDEFAVTALIAVGLFLDWYLSMYIVAVVMALFFLLVFFLARSPRYPWAEPHALWLWVLFLALSIFPAIRGASNSNDAFYYYPHIMLGALVMFWLGTVIARNVTSVYRFFNMLAGFSTLIAIHTIIVARTGKFLLSTSRIDTYLASVNNFTLTGSATVRVGSFLGNPDWNGAFLAMMFFVPVGLLAAASSRQAKLIYLAEAVILLFALLFTYAAASWIALVIGLIPLLTLVGRGFRRFWLPALIFGTIVITYYAFPSESALFIQHLRSPADAQIRLGAWQTALRVIQAFPLTGLGLSLSGYLLHAEPYRVPEQFAPLAHPHNAYLELGAMAGLPVLLVFLAILSIALWQSLYNWALADARARSLLGAGIAAIVTLSVNSWAINGWTLPPLAAAGWLILGVLSSPLLAKSLNNEKEHEESNSVRSPSVLSEQASLDADYL